MRIGFDLDGTLITCESKHCILMSAITTAFDLHFIESEYWKNKRHGLNNKLALIKQGISPDSAELINKIWIQSIENIEWAVYDKLLDRAIESLFCLRKKGHSLHLVSARNNINNAILQLKMLGINELFNTIDFVSVRSSNTKSFYFQKRKIECYFGDTEADFKESNIACIDFYPVLTGMRNKDFFINLGLEDKITLNLEQAIHKFF